MAWRTASFVKAFKAPKKSLGDLDAEAAATLIAAAADVAIVLDSAGVVRDVAFQSDDLSADLDGFAAWIGHPWIESVTVESRPKVETLLREAGSKATPRWRHLNHPSARGPDVPILYSAVRLGSDGRAVAFGRDLRAISALQQRLVTAQQSMERDYSRLRHVEMRYRLLFQMSAEAIMIIDAATQKVVEANPAAGQLLGPERKRVVGRPLAEVFDPESAQAVKILLAGVQAAGRAEDVVVRLAGRQRELTVSASMFREDNVALFLVRLAAAEAEAAAAAMPKVKSKLLQLVESAPDGFVVTGIDGRIITANAAFLDMVQIASEEQARGEPVDRWLGRPGVDLDVLIANLRQRGSIRLFSTTIFGELGGNSDVEISAVLLKNGGQPCFGFAVRNVGQRLSVETKSGRELPRSVDQLTELIGRVSLKDLVRETTDVIERLCIEAALEMTNDNRASAAEMLGLSRQSLYAKLRRYGIAEFVPEGRG